MSSFLPVLYVLSTGSAVFAVTSCTEHRAAALMHTAFFQTPWPVSVSVVVLVLIRSLLEGKTGRPLLLFQKPPLQFSEKLTLEL